MNAEIHDYRLQQYLQRSINNLPANLSIQLKHLTCCNKKMAACKNQNGFQKGIFVLSNGESSKLFGTATCKNRWVCPTCTAKFMAKTASDIAAALDALSEQNISASMITFTMPHCRSMRLWHMLEILNNAWGRVFRIHRAKTDKGFKNALARMYVDCQIQHRVRVAEITFGDNGWHPHFHCLFWTDDKFLQKIGDFEIAMRDEWNHAIKEELIKFYKKNPQAWLETKISASVEKLAHNLFHYTDKKKNHGVHVSRADDGSVRKIESSAYIAGWGGDSELTGSEKAKNAAEGHYTPRQLLLKARDENDSFAFYKYIELCLDLTKKRFVRVSWSRNGIRRIISSWKKVHGDSRAVKKNTTPAKFRAVCWFTSEQWYLISHENQKCERQIVADILELARFENAFTMITQYLTDLNILPHAPCENVSIECVEKIFNDACNVA